MAKRPAAAGSGSIRKRTVTRKDGTTRTFWEARYSLGLDPVTRKQRQKSITGSTQREVAQKLRAAVAAIDAGTYKMPCELTVGAFLDVWVKEYLVGCKPLTVKNYSEQVRKHLKPALGSIRLDKLPPTPSSGSTTDSPPPAWLRRPSRISTACSTAPSSRLC